MSGTRKMCAVAMLIALTVALSYISGFLRLGNIAKISISFISVYFAAAAFGPRVGGLVGGGADFISYLVNPTGALLWQITLLELLYGVLFGLFFARDFGVSKRNSFHMGKLSLLIFIRFISDSVLKTLVLMKAGFIVDSFKAAFTIRLPSVIAMVVIQLAVMLVINRFSKKIIYVIRGANEKS